MASVGNVVFIDCHIMDVTFLISLTLKNFSSALLLPIPASSLLYSLYISGGWLPSPSLAIHVEWKFEFVFVLDFESLINWLCAILFSLSHFSPSCILYCLFKQSTAHILFWLRFAILWVDWSINVFFIFSTSVNFWGWNFKKRYCFRINFYNNSTYRQIFHFILSEWQY